ncbi:peptidase domain-containing ABC transporter [Moraxella catarrhalis]|uniref:peptidase domain-containing ABC transporter n=1 Tax=Moraxella catarrhalis TaxID=480 RepID=UPI000EAA4901|nr:peptidase domain-containing ABC transporter [Moraxella catarrhalis]MPW73548.1 ABC transporter [Moraxella catarrhalis]MPX05674.1 peptidase domain-containing ABC transporter [Moraxella catarrhalis]MPX48609.1 peptidase domain-containing ABC transporter [Moraxella catarrhalis]MPX65488.1 peptidase domain-containing ABC transporter [Moraxella catarrhalis]RKL73431.1 peptidase domain-containing ABC transporter [Moraxella catarrhalis]
MNYLQNLSFGFSRKLPTILQTESAECGLACLAMISSYHGYKTDLFALRQKYTISQKGVTLATLIKIANQLHLTSRPLHLEIDELSQLRTPCILHWDLNHFVVLQSVGKHHIAIIDPAVGIRKIHNDEVSNHFTGIALELWADSKFEKKNDKTNIHLFKLIGEIRGLYGSLGQILVLALTLEVFALISPFFMQWVIDHAIVSADTNLLVTLVIGFGLLMILTQLINLLQSWVVMHLSTTLNIQWKANIFHHLIHLPSSFFQKRHLGDIVSRFGSINSIQSTLTTTFLTAILDGLMTVFTLVLMFLYSPSLAWIAIVAMGVYALLRWIWYMPLRRATEEEIIHASKQNTHFMETMRGIRAIKRYNKQDHRQNTYLALLVDQINAGLRTQKLGLMFGFINGIIFGLENLIIIYLGASFVIEGGFTVGVLMAFLAYKNQFGSRISSLIDKFVEVKMLSLHGERLADIVLTDREQSSVFAHNGNMNNYSKYDIEVNNLSFRYSEDEPRILKDVSFYIPENHSVAIIGATGCGKSTLMSILMGELQPQSGEIKIAGRSIKSLEELNAYGIVAYVSQEDTLFAGSLLENISFFDHQINANWAEECAKMVGIHDEIMAMPMGYQTLVGDMGSALSGGQKQRIFIARALYRKPKILFLDEATSHLNIEKEREINEMIKSLNITRIMIAHRPETIASADWVLRLHKGKVVLSQDI